MKECYSRKKKTSRISRLLILLIIIAGVLFGVYASMAPVYTYAAELVSYLECPITMSTSGEAFKIGLIFSSTPQSTIAGMYNVMPSKLQIEIPAGENYASTSEYLIGGICDFSIENESGKSANLGWSSDQDGNATSTKTLSSSLPSSIGTTGTFTISFTKYEKYCSGGTKTKTDEEKYSVSFIIDNSAPEMASLPSATNTSFEVAGVNASTTESVSIKWPGTSAFATYEQPSYTVPNTTGNDGLYECYITNIYGTNSDIVKVRLDTVEPHISYDTYSEPGYVVVTATDDTASMENGGVHIEGGRKNGVVTKYSQSSLMIERNSGYGDYEFYAVDEAGNKSDILSFTVSSVSVPGGLIIEEDGTGFRYVLDDTSWSVTVNGEQYDGGWIMTEGEYEIVVKDADGVVREEYTQIVKHDLRLVSQTDATCTQSGAAYYECKYCGETDEIEIPAKGHLYEYKTTAATCLIDGLKEYTCVYCGHYYSEAIPAAGEHNYVYDRTVETNSCGVASQEVWICSNCGAEDRRDIEGVENAHTGSYIDFDDPRYKEATCTEDGVWVGKCSDCGAEWLIDLPATGHFYTQTSWEYYGKGDYYEYYDDDGIWCKVTDVRVITYKCQNLGCVDPWYTEILVGYYDGIFGELLSWFEQYQMWFWIIAGALAVVWGIYAGIKYATAVNENGKEKAKKQLWTLIIGIIAVFVIICGVPYLVRGIAYWLI